MKQTIQSHFQGNYQLFYSRYLPHVKKIGGQEYQALCPFHEDRKPSLNFNNETGAYFCHGCGKKGGPFHFYARTHSLRDRDDFSKILRGIASDFAIPWEKQEEKHLIKTYDYTDKEGTLLFQVCRFDPKDFRQRRPNGDGGWIWDLKGVQTVLYRLPSILNAQEVVIVEGEKDADTLTSLGFTATTSPMGAKKWRDHYNEALRGKDLILCPDNDPEGREHMMQVAISLNGTSKGMKWLELPGVPSKGDISDWVAGFRDREEAKERLAMMIENADPYTPPKQKSHEDVILKVGDFSLLNLPEKAEYLKPWLKENSINLVSGWRGAGKTWFAMGLCDALTRGVSFGPWECSKPADTLILDGEMPPSDIMERVQGLNLNSERPASFFIYSDALANQWGLPRAHLASESWRTKMKAILTTKHIKVWVIDNLASLASGLDENSKKDWDPINQWLLELRFAGISTIMLHHVSKEGDQRGTSAREDNLDISIILKAPHDYTPEDGARFICHFGKARVATRDLSLIGDIEFKLVEEVPGRLAWVWGNVKRERKKEILRMLDDGKDYEAIMDNLDISKGYISKVKKEATEQGMMARNGKLTQSGTLFVMEN